jgi:hypothetical protein
MGGKFLVKFSGLDADLGRGATEAEVAAAERELGLSFPEDFREFLREVGWAEVGPLAVAGLGRGVPEGLSLTEAALGAWASGVPKTLLPVGDDSGGVDFIFLDLAAGGRAVVLPEGEAAPRVLAASFTEWLSEELSGMTEEDGG